MRPIVFKSSFRSESGVLLPIAAFMILLLVGVTIHFGVDQPRIKRAAANLSLRAEQICESAVQESSVHTEAISRFKRGVEITNLDKNLSPDFTLVGAKIIMPTMPDDGCFGFRDAVNNDCTASPPVRAGGPETFADLSAINPQVSACNLSCAASPHCQSDCYFQGEVDGPLAGYPDGLWNDLQNAGNTVGCELTATVDTILSGKGKKIVAKTVWKKFLRGEYEDPRDPSSDLNQRPSLSVVVAPHMETHANDPRFWFKSGHNYIDPATAVPTNVPFANNKFDPLHEWGLPNGVQAFKESLPPITTPYTLPQPGPPGIHLLSSPWSIHHRCQSPLHNSTFSDITTPPSAADIYCDDDLDPLTAAPVARSGHTVGTPYLEANASTYTLSDVEEMLTACMNPAVMVRNLLISSILEHAARNGELRMRTQFLMTGTQSRISTNTAQHWMGTPTKLTPPVELVEFGQDLMPPSLADRYQIPYVHFQSGYPGESVPPEFQHKFGLINPFIGPGSVMFKDPSSNLTNVLPVLEHHTLIANQLRFCYQLFEGTSLGIERPETPGIYISNAPSHTYLNDGFEPSSAFGFDDKLRNESYPGTSTRWDQDCPWNGGVCPTSSATRKLTAPELAASLGTIQSCPYYQGNFLTSLPGYSSGRCEKPAIPISSDAGSDFDNPGNDLRGDLVATLCVLKGSLPSPGVNCGNDLRAVAQPGLFPMDFTDEVAIQSSDHPFGTDAGGNPAPWAYKSVPTNESSAILLVTHHKLSNPEITQIARLTRDSGPLGSRPITVVYIPYFDWDTESTAEEVRIDETIRDFERAFHIPPGGADPTDNTANALFVLSPYLPKYNPDHPYYGEITRPANIPTFTGSQSQRFRDYWMYLLLDPYENIDIVARNIFYQRLLRTQLIY